MQICPPISSISDFFSNAPWSNPLFQPTIHILYPLPTHSLNTYFPFPSVPLSPQTQAQEKQHMNHIYRDISILFSSYLLIIVPYFVGSFKSQLSSSRHAATSSLKMTCLLILLLILVVPLSVGGLLTWNFARFAFQCVLVNKSFYCINVFLCSSHFWTSPDTPLLHRSLIKPCMVSCSVDCDSLVRFTPAM